MARSVQQRYHYPRCPPPILHAELSAATLGDQPVGNPTDLLPPPNCGYVSPQQWHALYAQCIVISNVTHKFFTDSHQPPTPGNTDTHSFGSVLNLDVSLDGGATFYSLQSLQADC